MDLFPSIFEVPNAVFIERFVMCLAISSLTLLMRIEWAIRAVMVTAVFLTGYLSLYLTWKTFVIAN